jgi:hypothetical protein
MLWAFTRNDQTGLPSSSLLAKTEWHPKLVANVRGFLTEVDKKFGLKTVVTLGNKLAKEGLEEIALTGAVTNGKWNTSRNCSPGEM